MHKVSDETAIENAAASVEMEGFVVTEQYKELCKDLLENKITMNDYIKIICSSQGVNA